MAKYLMELLESQETMINHKLVVYSLKMREWKHHFEFQSDF